MSPLIIISVYTQRVCNQLAKLTSLTAVFENDNLLQGTQNQNQNENLSQRYAPLRHESPNKREPSRDGWNELRLGGFHRED
jgi:hypothetical protein